MLAKIATAAVALLAASSYAGASQNACFSRLESGVPSSRLAVLARGFNLTGWLDGEAPRRPDLALLATLSARGLTHIRLPVKAELLMDAFSSPQGMSGHRGELDTAIRTLLTLGFGVSLDVHPGSKFGNFHRDNPEEGFRLLRELWLELARRYREYSADRLFFEVLNEPSVAEETWNQQGPRLVELIRREAPRHTIIYGPANYQQISTLSGIEPLNDSNVVYAVHFYEPMIFTHQGLNWGNDPLRYLHGVPFPAALSDRRIVQLIDGLLKTGHGEAIELLRSQLRSPWNKERVSAVIARAANWARHHRKPVILNEFGVLGWKAPPRDRVQWIEAVRRAAEVHCLGWAHWEYADGFGFVRRLRDREIPDDAVLEALVGSRG